MRATLTCVSPQGHEVRSDLSSALSPDLREVARVEANAWIKRLRLVPFDGRSLRERFTYRGDSLWWFTELYLHKGRRLDLAVSATLAFDAARDRHAPARLIVETDDLVVQHVAEAFGRARGVAVEIRGTAVNREKHGRDSYLIGLTARLSRLRPAHARPTGHTRVAAFVHTAFWREVEDGDGPEQESYIGPALGETPASLLIIQERIEPLPDLRVGCRAEHDSR